jgi:hypothetical protein
MLAGYFCQASAPWGAMSTAAIISFRRRLFIEVEMCPVHIFDIREAKIGKEIQRPVGQNCAAAGGLDGRAVGRRRAAGA